MKNAEVYKCPADRGIIEDTAITRYRSFSLSGYMNGPAADTTSASNRCARPARSKTIQDTHFY